MNRNDFAELVRTRLHLERGRMDKQAPFTIGLAYPSPYRVGMSSLGFQQIYKAIQNESGMACERVFLPDDAGSGPVNEPPLSYEQLRPLSEFPVIALSVAYELELAGIVQLLEAAGIPALRQKRRNGHPVVVAGGPITFANPLPLAAFADVIVMGEADTLVLDVLRILRDHPQRDEALSRLAKLPHVMVPAEHADVVPTIAQCQDELLPAWSTIRTPDTELSDMFLIETERGCSRGCTYCVMRRSTNGGMRVVPKERLFELIPDDAHRVGLVGAAVSDHPHIVSIVRDLADRGSEVGLSSLRPDRLRDDFVAALKAAGYRTLTTAMDGASDRLRRVLDRKAKVRHLEQAAELTRAHEIPRLKLYLMVGVPTETDDDIDECAEFISQLSKRIPISLAIAPFCAKRNTPLDGHPFAGIKTVDARLARLRRKLKGRADVRATSARWAWVEYELSQGTQAQGNAVYDAVFEGGRFRHYKKALESVTPPTRRKLPVH